MLLLLVGEVDAAFGLGDDDFKAKYGVPKPAANSTNFVFVCAVGVRSLTACKMVEKYGYAR